MKSERKSAASRANGAKSHGPKSAETKEISSRNSLQHGFTAKKTVVLAVESPERFQEMLDDYAEKYQPGSPVEEDLVAEMVAAKWRMQRLRMIETALMDDEMKRQLSASEAPDDPGARIASGFKRLVDESRAISLASRYESRLYRIHAQSHRTLRELQQSRKERTAAPPTAEPVAPAPIQPEPPTEAPVSPLLSAPRPESSRENEILRNEPDAAPAKDRRPLSIAGRRGFRRIDIWRIDIKEPRYFGQRKSA